MSMTPQALHFHLNRLVNTHKFLIAYSGGVDSHVLLHLCSRLKSSRLKSSRFKKNVSAKELEFSAVYIDHGLSPDARRWGQHCQQICYELNIPLSIIEVNASPENGQSPEAAARKARYQAFSEILTPGECLLTAQHLDDQAETVLLQLMRGSGSRGLSAMPEIKAFGNGYLCRPMLEVNKRMLLDYAQQHQLHWIEDESNQEQRFERNFLRHSIVPELQKHWPSVQRNIARTAHVLAESQYLLDTLAEEDFAAAVETENKQTTVFQEPAKLVLNKVRSLISQMTLKPVPDNTSQPFGHNNSRFKLARVHNLLRYWIHLNDLPMPSRKILQQVVETVIFSSDNASPLVSWKRDQFKCDIRKYRNTLYLINRTGQPDIDEQLIKNSYILKPDQPVSIPGIGTLSIESDCELISKPLTIRFRQGGERFRKYKGAPSSLLKHWFQEQAIPPWERDYWPLIYSGDELIQVAHTIVKQDYFADNNHPACIICFKPESLNT